MIDETTKIIVMHESVSQSVAKDAFSLGSMAALAWFNHVYLGGAWPFDAFVVAIILAFGVSRSRRAAVHCTIAELKSWALASARKDGRA